MRTPVVAVSIGMFDGVHRGHQAVLAEAREAADRAGASLLAFTFDEHPRTVLAEEPPGPRLSSPGTRVALLRAAGVDAVRVLRFRRELAAKSPRQFLLDHVLPFGRLAALVVGYDFAMGRDRAGTAAHLTGLGAESGFTVRSVPPVFFGGSPISSSRIRNALAGGQVEEAARLLGRPYRVVGLVVSGDGRGRMLGFPTANLAVEDRLLLPGGGVYAVRIGGVSPATWPAVLNLGLRPTFGGGPVTAEAHLIGFTGDLLGRRLKVEFVARIREERRFEGPGALIEQIARDVGAARARLGESAAGPA